MKLKSTVTFVREYHVNSYHYIGSVIEVETGILTEDPREVSQHPDSKIYVKVEEVK